MTLTIQSLEGYARRRLDGLPSLSITDLANQAGEYLVSMHPWQWLRRPPTSLSLAAGMTFIQLPALSRIDRIVSSTLCMELVTLTQIADMRTFNSSSDGYCGALVYDTNMSPRLEIYPTPTTTTPNAFSLYYYDAWPVIESVIPIPSWMEAFFIEVFLAHAQGHDEHDLGMRYQRLTALEASPEFLRVKRRDGGVQTDIGYPSGGALQMQALMPGPRIDKTVAAADPT